MSEQLAISVGASVRSVEEFSTFAKLAARLKRHGEVRMSVSSLTGKTFDDVPPGGSAWHDYTSCLASLEKFYPHPKLEAFINKEYVARNRKLLNASMAVARQHGMGASVSIHAPWFLPSAFFDAYPTMRGARVDHPRRSRREAFAVCTDTPEGQEFYAQMVAALVKDVPELAGMEISTNDAGGGFCWADWLYSGPNGADHCRNRDAGQRVRDLVDAVRRGAGKMLDVHVRANWSRHEYHLLQHQMDEQTFFSPRFAPDPRLIGVGTLVENPVVGMIEPIGILKTLEKLKSGKIRKLGIGFGTDYARDHDLPEMAERVIELVDAYLSEQPAAGALGRLNFLRKMCAKWTSEKQADAMVEAFITLHEALAYRSHTMRMFTANYCGVSMRHITRPLVPVPELLSREEESYFLKHVFNIHESEARSDYIDWHGGRLEAAFMEMPEDGETSRPTDRFRSMLNDAAKTLEGLDGPEAAIFRRMAISLRMVGCVIRSVGNFYSAQLARDRRKAELTPRSEPYIPPKEGDWGGDVELQRINHAMRHELNNTVELIGLLENGGLQQVAIAKRPEDEDTFYLGPDLVEQLKKKCAVMRDHWADGQKYLRIPHK